jgi:thiamine-phosphate pyrophosphorylase
MMIELTLPRFYPVLDTRLLEARGLRSEEAAKAVLAAGARILQFRHKMFFSCRALAEATRVAALCRKAGALFVVNDRADIALLLEGAVHLGQDDLAPDDVRRFLPRSAAIGYSTHNERQLAEATAQPADYIALGPIFSTVTKDNPDPVVGVSELRRLRPLVSRPLVAIGGITRENARRTLDAGADSVAVIGDLIPAEGGAAALRARTEEWLQLLRN